MAASIYGVSFTLVVFAIGNFAEDHFQTGVTLDGAHFLGVGVIALALSAILLYDSVVEREKIVVKTQLDGEQP